MMPGRQTLPSSAKRNMSTGFLHKQLTELRDHSLQLGKAGDWFPSPQWRDFFVEKIFDQQRRAKWQIQICNSRFSLMSGRILVLYSMSFGECFMWKAKAEAGDLCFQLCPSCTTQCSNQATLLWLWKSSDQISQDLTDLYKECLPRYPGRGRARLKQIYTGQNILNSSIWDAVSISATCKSPDRRCPVRQWLNEIFQSCNSVPSPRWHVQGPPRHNLLPKFCLFTYFTNSHSLKSWESAYWFKTNTRKPPSGV